MTIVTMPGLRMRRGAERCRVLLFGATRNPDANLDNVIRISRITTSYRTPSSFRLAICRPVPMLLF